MFKYYCGAREFVVSAHFPLGPKARADPRRGELLPRTCRESPSGLEMQPRMTLSSASQGLEGKNDTSSKAALQSAPRGKCE